MKSSSSCDGCRFAAAELKVGRVGLKLMIGEARAEVAEEEEEEEVEGGGGLLDDRIGRNGIEGEFERLDLESPANSFKSEGLLFSFTGPPSPLTFLVPLPLFFLKLAPN